MGERSVVHEANGRQLRPFPGKAYFRRNGGRTWAHVNFRRTLFPLSLCLSFRFILGCMHSTQYISMIYPHIGPRVHHHILHCKVSLQRSAASKPSLPVVCFRIRERRSHYTNVFQFFDFYFYFYFSFASRLRFAVFCGYLIPRMDHGSSQSQY